MPTSSEELLQQAFASMPTDKLRERVNDPDITPLARKLAQNELARRLHPDELPIDDPDTRERLATLYAGLSLQALNKRARDPALTSIARQVLKEELAWRNNKASPEYARMKNQRVEDALKEKDAKRTLTGWLLGGSMLMFLGGAVCITVLESWTPIDLIIYALCFFFILAMIFGKLFPRTSRAIAIFSPPLVLCIAWYYWKHSTSFVQQLLVIILPPAFLFAAYRMYKASLNESSYAAFLEEVEETAHVFRPDE